MKASADRRDLSNRHHDATSDTATSDTAATSDSATSDGAATNAKGRSSQVRGGDGGGGGGGGRPPKHALRVWWAPLPSEEDFAEAGYERKGQASSSATTSGVTLLHVRVCI